MSETTGHTARTFGDRTADRSLNHASERRAEDIFLEVSSLPPERWESRIVTLSAGNAALAAEVRSLLGFHAQAEDFLDGKDLAAQISINPAAGGWSGPDEVLPPGTRVGEYTIQSLLGAGGMGAVYVAEQEKPRRTVALKIIRPGVGTRGLIRRFEHEAEILGRLHHPGIAQVYEAGAAPIGVDHTTRPFIAMELIRGPTLTDFADQQNLSTPARLDLLARVADAVHHAHQRGVIHRDLKPANILVDENGQPKVLDFGVARAADADQRITTMQTSIGQLIGTLPYMSPEQVLGDQAEVDIRSDVYALGVILYRLLTGRLPLDLSSRSIPEAARVIREENPERLSHVSKLFRGEVDTIVFKALEKDKTRRYQSAANLADDLRRHLRGEPIQARGDSLLYVFRKQMARHRLAFAAAAVFLIGLAVFAGYAQWQARVQSGLAESERLSRLEADAARDVASRRADELQRALYASRIGHARAAIVIHDVAKARAELDQCIEKDRGWEWSLLSRMCDQSIARITLPEGAQSVKVSPDGSTLYATTSIGPIAVFDRASGRVTRSIPSRHRSGVLSISPDGRTLATRSGASGAHIFDAATGDYRGEVGGSTDSSPPAQERRVQRVEFLRDGQVLVARHNGDVEVFDSGSLRPLRAFPTAMPTITSVAASRDGTKFALGTAGGRARVFDAQTGKILFDPDPFGGSVVAAAFSNDGQSLALGLFTGSIAVADLAGVHPIRTARFDPVGIGDLFFSDDDRLVVCSDRGRRLFGWNARTLELEWTQYGEPRDIGSLCPLPGTGTFLTSGDRDTGRIWSLEPRPAVPIVGTGLGIMFSLCSAPDGEGFVVVGRTGTQHRIDQRGLTASPVHCRIPTPSRATIALADGSLATLNEDASLYLWRASDPTPEHTIPLPLQRGLRVAASRDGSTIVASGTNGALVLLDRAHDLAVRTLRDDGTAITDLDISAHDVIALAHSDGSVEFLDFSGAEVHSPLLAQGTTARVAFNADGSRIAVVFDRGSGRIVDFSSGATTELKVAQLSTLLSPVFLPGGTRLAAVSADQTVRIWSTETGDELVALSTPTGPQTLLALSPDGKTLASTGTSGQVVLWELEPPGLTNRK
jgi:WD40 repeat protein